MYNQCLVTFLHQYKASMQRKRKKGKVIMVFFLFFQQSETGGKFSMVLFSFFSAQMYQDIHFLTFYFAPAL